MKNVDDGADAIGLTKFDALPERVREALGELAGAAKEGLLALSVGVGLRVVHELMELEVTEVVGLLVESRGPSVAIGDFCEVRTSAGRRATPTARRPRSRPAR